MIMTYLRGFIEIYTLFYIAFAIVAEDLFLKVWFSRCTLVVFQLVTSFPKLFELNQVVVTFFAWSNLTNKTCEIESESK